MFMECSWLWLCPALTLTKTPTAAVTQREERVGKDVVGLDIAETGVMEAAAMGALALDAVGGQLHVHQPPGDGGALLTIDIALVKMSNVSLNAVLRCFHHGHPINSINCPGSKKNRTRQ
jgi:hypothetical protein